jgi:hypothetical protein
MPYRTCGKSIASPEAAHGLFEPFSAEAETYVLLLASLISERVTRERVTTSKEDFDSVFRSLMLFTVLGFSIVSAKTFQFTLETATKAGSVDLQAGKYNLELMDNSKVRFIGTNGKAVEVSAKLSTVDKKFDSTQVTVTSGNGASQLNEIDLGGTKTKIEFE